MILKQFVIRSLTRNFLGHFYWHRQETLLMMKRFFSFYFIVRH